MKNREQVMVELDLLVPEGYNGSVTLHCVDGAVQKYEVHASVRAGRVRGLADLSEQGGNGTHEPAPEPTGPPLRDVTVRGTPLRGGPR